MSNLIILSLGPSIPTSPPISAYSAGRRGSMATSESNDVISSSLYLFLRSATSTT
uniref:Uncharacterized protein n=1 Tax=Arundo donax TaxID=35708 RepID=A0A0A9A259_ARUDO